jgi:hypothetical protein
LNQPRPTLHGHFEKTVHRLDPIVESECPGVDFVGRSFCSGLELAEDIRSRGERLSNWLFAHELAPSSVV